MTRAPLHLRALHPADGPVWDAGLTRLCGRVLDGAGPQSLDGLVWVLRGVLFSHPGEWVTEQDGLRRPMHARARVMARMAIRQVMGPQALLVALDCAERLAGLPVTDTAHALQADVTWVGAAERAPGAGDGSEGTGTGTDSPAEPSGAREAEHLMAVLDLLDWVLVPLDELEGPPAPGAGGPAGAGRHPSPLAVAPPPVPVDVPAPWAGTGSPSEASTPPHATDGLAVARPADEPPADADVTGGPSPVDFGLSHAELLEERSRMRARRAVACLVLLAAQHDALQAAGMLEQSPSSADAAQTGGQPVATGTEPAGGGLLRPGALLDLVAITSDRSALPEPGERAWARLGLLVRMTVTAASGELITKKAYGEARQAAEKRGEEWESSANIEAHYGGQERQGWQRALLAAARLALLQPDRLPASWSYMSTKVVEYERPEAVKAVRRARDMMGFWLTSAEYADWATWQRRTGRPSATEPLGPRLPGLPQFRRLFGRGGYLKALALAQGGS